MLNQINKNMQFLVYKVNGLRKRNDPGNKLF